MPWLSPVVSKGATCGIGVESRTTFGVEEFRQVLGQDREDGELPDSRWWPPPARLVSIRSLGGRLVLVAVLFAALSHLCAYVYIVRTLSVCTSCGGCSIWRILAFASAFLAISSPSFRRRSLLGGYKAYSEAVEDSRRGNSEAAAEDQPQDPADEEEISTSSPRKRGRTHNSVRKTRRLSEAPPESERMPGAELAGGGIRAVGGEARDGSGGGGGLARCQRVWKMVPPAKDKRPTWLRQYEVRGHIVQVIPWLQRTIMRAIIARLVVFLSKSVLAA